jgi:hypothetical protein
MMGAVLAEVEQGFNQSRERTVKHGHPFRTAVNHTIV